MRIPIVFEVIEQFLAEAEHVLRQSLHHELSPFEHLSLDVEKFAAISVRNMKGEAIALKTAEEWNPLIEHLLHAKQQRVSKLVPDYEVEVVHTTGACTRLRIAGPYISHSVRASATALRWRSDTHSVSQYFENKFAMQNRVSS